MTAVRYRWASTFTVVVAVTAALAVSPRLFPSLFEVDGPAAGGGRRVGVLCRISGSDGVEASATLRRLCDGAVGLLARRAQGNSGADGPAILIALEPRPPWAGGARPRILLRVVSAWSGWRFPVLGSPSTVIDPADPGWRERAEEALGRMVDALATDG